MLALLPATNRRRPPSGFLAGAGIGLFLLTGGATVLYAGDHGSDYEPQNRATVSSVQQPPCINPQSFQNKLFAMPLPKGISQQQQQEIAELVNTARPKLTLLHLQLTSTLDELHNLSFDSDTPPDALVVLGRRLSGIRKAILHEMRLLAVRVHEKTGCDPGWGTPPGNMSVAKTLSSPEQDE